MSINPFNPRIIYENDMDDFKMPYRLYGQTDLEVMTAIYQRLHNRSTGETVRFKHGKATG